MSNEKNINGGNVEVLFRKLGEKNQGITDVPPLKGNGDEIMDILDIGEKNLESIKKNIGPVDNVQSIDFSRKKRD